MRKEPLLDAIPEDLILSLTKRLVAIPTPNPPGREAPLAEFVVDTLRGWGIETERVPHPDPERPQVVAWLRGSTGSPTLILNAHMDTVGAGDLDEWQYNPFQATRRGNRLYGLGTCDMKGSLAAAMVILKVLRDARVRFRGTLMLQAAMGEEMDEPGTRTLLQEGFTGDYAIVLEPTDLRLGPASRGVSWFKIALEGPSVHCGLASADSPDVMAGFSRVAAALMSYHRRIAALRHPFSPPPGCRITRVEAGRAHNSLVDVCEFVLDRRMIPGETVEHVETELRRELKTALSATPEIEFRLEFLQWNEPVQAPLDSPVIAALQENATAVTGHPAQIWAVPYGCDVRNFIYDANIPAVNFGAGDYRVCHGPNEFVPVDGLMACARAVMGAAIDLLS